MQHLPPRTRRQIILASSLTITGIIGWTIWQRTKTTTKPKTITNNNNNKQIQHMSARDFIQSKSENEHDELAQSVIANRMKSKQEQIDLTHNIYKPQETNNNVILGGGQFTYDVTKTGLISSLKMLSELKQAEEDHLVKIYRQTGKYPIDNPNETFKRLRREKEEVAQLIRKLEGKQPYLWGWIWR
jgi:hypothetical protein